MGITTKTGDKGRTSLCQGKRVSKDDLRIEACGVLDELCSYLGLVKCLLKSKKEKTIIESIQKNLFVAGAEIALNSKSLSKLKERITKIDVESLDKIIGDLEKNKKFKNHCFCMPGGNTIFSFLDIARTIIRRAERRVTTLVRKKNIKNEYILIYLNRVSDLLFLLARLQEKNPHKLK